MPAASKTNIDLASYQAFIFDLDGTLLDSEKYHLSALAKALRELAGYELTEADEHEFNGNTSLSLARSLNRKHGLGLDPQETARRKFEILYENYRSEPYPGVMDFLSAWHGRTHFAVASNSPREFVDIALTQLGILGWFPTIVTIDDVQKRKPDPEMFRQAVVKLGLRPVDCIIFEDSLPGLQAAVATGCQVLLMDNPGNSIPETVPDGVSVVRWAGLLQPEDTSRDSVKTRSENKK